MGGCVGVGRDVKLRPNKKGGDDEDSLDRSCKLVMRLVRLG